MGVNSRIIGVAFSIDTERHHAEASAIQRFNDGCDVTGNRLTRDFGRVKRLDIIGHA